MRIDRRFLVTLLIACGFAAGARADDWPQLGQNPSKNHHSPDEPQGPYGLPEGRQTRPNFVKSWKDQVLWPTHQPIIVQGVVYVGTQSGHVHAVDCESGEQLWTGRVDAIIVSSLAGDRDRIYVFCLDGNVFALERSTGEVAWNTRCDRRGFSAAPLLIDDHLYCGNRAGIFYSIRCEDGRPEWEFAADAPIQTPAAGTTDRIVFVDESLHVHCLSPADGKPVWSHSPRLAGGFVAPWWPVIHRGRVVIRTQVAGPMNVSHAPWLLQHRMTPGASSIAQMIAEQRHVRSYFQEYPATQTFHVLNLADGSTAYIPGIFAECANTGVTPPPTMAGDGRLYTVFRTTAGPGSDHVIGGKNDGIINISRAAVGHFNIDTGLLDAPIVARHASVVGFDPQAPDNDIATIPVAPWEITTDETVSLSSGGNLIFGIRNDAIGGIVSLDGKTVAQLPNANLPRAHDMQNPPQHYVISGRYICLVKFNTLFIIQGESSTHLGS